MTRCDHCGGEIAHDEASMLIVVGGRPPRSGFALAAELRAAFSVYHELCYTEHDVPVSELAQLGTFDGDALP